MSLCLVTGSAGLIGSEAVRHFAGQGYDVIGLDNNLRQTFFGPDASTLWNRDQLQADVPAYQHRDLDIRDREGVDALFKEHGKSISLIIHAAAQPSHDWAARDPIMDFTVNANGTLNLLQSMRDHAPEAVFVFCSTNKVYGDTPNALPLQELETRWEIDPSHAFAPGIPETMSIDNSKHSLFGASKVAADILVQEYGKYFGLRTGAFRGGCLTGPRHSGTQLHGFLSYLMRCVATGKQYTIYGYKGKQVRDNIHAADLISAFDAFSKAPRCGEVYNIGGGRFSNCSMAEAITECEAIAGKKGDIVYAEANRIGDHIWYVSDLAKFQAHYPDWKLRYDCPAILREIYEQNLERWQRELA